jgi:hypothetical protein
MENNRNNLYLVLLALILVLPSCGLFQKKQQIVTSETVPERITKYTLIDSFNKDRFEKVSVCILTDSASVYEMDNGGALVKIGVMYLGDTLSVSTPQDFHFWNLYYRTIWHGRKAFIYGTQLGQLTTDIDFDGDNKPDKIIYGFSDYDTSQASGSGLHPYWVRFISATGNKSEVRDSGYAEMDIEEMKDDSATLLFTAPTKIFRIGSGYPACGYMWYYDLIAFTANGPALVRRYDSSMDSGQGYDWIVGLPTIKTNHRDTIYMVKYLNTLVDENTYQIAATPLDSSITYFKSGRWNTTQIWHSPADSLESGQR